MWILDETVQNIIKEISGRNTFTEKELKRKLKVKENEIRKVLYKLHELGIVYPIKAVVVKEGKYDYMWGVKVKELKRIFDIVVKREIERLEKEKESLPEIVYVCEECGISFEFDTAESMDFKCPECESILMPVRNRRLEEIVETIEKLNALLEAVKEVKVVKAKA